jgi:hypothetical protein
MLSRAVCRSLERCCRGGSGRGLWINVSRDGSRISGYIELDGYDFKMKNSGTFLHRKSGGLVFKRLIDLI